MNDSHQDPREECKRLIASISEDTLQKHFKLLKSYLSHLANGERTNLIQIDGCIESKLTVDEWTDVFIDWLESRGESFGGGCSSVTNY